MASCSATPAISLCSLLKLNCRVSPAHQNPPLRLPSLSKKPILSPPSLRFSVKKDPPLAPSRFSEADAPVLEVEPGQVPETESTQIVETAGEVPKREEVFAVVMVRRGALFNSSLFAFSLWAAVISEGCVYFTMSALVWFCQIGSRQYIVFPGRYIYTQRLRGANVNDKVGKEKSLVYPFCSLARSCMRWWRLF